MTDIRDGAVYQTVTYEPKGKKDSATSMTWMAQNLNFNSPESHCFANEEANCETNGRLYNWFDATKVCPLMKTGIDWSTYMEESRRLVSI